MECAGRALSGDGALAPSVADSVSYLISSAQLSVISVVSRSNPSQQFRTESETLRTGREETCPTPVKMRIAAHS